MSIAITFPDGRTESFEQPPTGLDIAQQISPGLAKKAVVVKVDGELRDLTRPIAHDAHIEIVTRDQPEGLEVLRHDAAHVLAQAVQELFPGTQITFGPTTDTGFYYDFVRDEPFSEADLEAIEQRMKEIVQRCPSGARSGTAMRPSSTSRTSARPTRPNGSPRASIRTRRSRSTPRARTGAISVSARICRRRGGWAPPSS